MTEVVTEVVHLRKHEDTVSRSSTATPGSGLSFSPINIFDSWINDINKPSLTPVDESEEPVSPGSSVGSSTCDY